MNNYRNWKHLVIISLLSINALFFLLMIIFYLRNPHDALDSSPFIAFLSGWASISFNISMYAIYVYVLTKKDYQAQVEKYNHKFVKANMKRELSALMMTILTSFMIYPIFPMINAWLKSGLNERQRKYAKRQIRIKHVDDLLAQKKVIEHLKNHPEEAKLIKEAISLREKGIDTVYNCSIYIMIKLNAINAPFEIVYDEKEIYYIGMNL